QGAALCHPPPRARRGGLVDRAVLRQWRARIGRQARASAVAISGDDALRRSRLWAIPGPIAAIARRPSAARRRRGAPRNLRRAGGSGGCFVYFVRGAKGRAPVAAQALLRRLAQ